jgi:hypothetical protein
MGSPRGLHSRGWDAGVLVDSDYCGLCITGKKVTANKKGGVNDLEKLRK